MDNQQMSDEESHRKLDLALTMLDDLIEMYLKLENDLWISGIIQKKYSDDGKRYDALKDN